jgi:hypothetical protein
MVSNLHLYTDLDFPPPSPAGTSPPGNNTKVARHEKIFSQIFFVANY